LWYYTKTILNMQYWTNYKDNIFSYLFIGVKYYGLFMRKTKIVIVICFPVYVFIKVLSIIFL